jgi:alpha-ribazole phosphatase/probable phosphoglycerate mutase
MSQVLVVRPGSTALDEQERIKGCLDIPLSESGRQQVLRAIDEYADVELKMIYCAPCESAQATARMIAEKRQCKWKVCDFFRNIDHGLWQGRCIEEIRRQQPKLYKQIQDNPSSFSPPGGESLADAQQRVAKQVMKLQRKHANETIAIVISEPLATLVATQLKSTQILDLWKSECDKGSWELIPT